VANLVLGPLLRHVDPTRATVWVETDAPATVTVLGCSTRAFTIHRRHYALVVIEGLRPGSRTEYDVRLDGEVRWPEPRPETLDPHDPTAKPLPPSVIRTPEPGASSVRLAFGSCRLTLPPDVDNSLMYGVDALQALAREAVEDRSKLPDLLFLAGDQVYADEATRAVSNMVTRDGRESRPPKGEIADFEEYARLYGVAWSEPLVRWMFSTVPTVMIFDDHDVRDDWNISAAWRAEMAAKPWWSARIVGALASYWIYQHLGNMDPESLEQDALLAAVRRAKGDAGGLLDEFAARADKQAESARWSFVRDIGRVRLLVVDTRSARVVDPRQRQMLDPGEWAWMVEHAHIDPETTDHLLIGSSLPLLLPRAIHDAEAWNEAVCAGAWGRRWEGVGERVRQAVDLEHWAAFRESFSKMTALLREIAIGRDGHAPASVLVLSGDVHHSYAAQLRLPGVRTPVWQLVCSPFRNPLPRQLRVASALVFTRPSRALGRVLARSARSGDPRVRWRITQGPWFDNMVATVQVSGRAATVRWDRALSSGELAERGRLLVLPQAAGRPVRSYRARMRGRRWRRRGAEARPDRRGAP
jgi:hypothetical protein